MPVWKQIPARHDKNEIAWELQGGYFSAEVAVTPVGVVVSVAGLASPGTDEAALDHGKALAEKAISLVLKESKTRA